LTKELQGRTEKEFRKQFGILLLNILSDEKFDDHKSMNDYKILATLIEFAEKEQNDVIYFSLYFH